MPRRPDLVYAAVAGLPLLALEIHIGGASIGVAGLIGLFLGWKRLQHARDKQLADRFQGAVDQLAADDSEVRIGGIGAVEQVAQDSRKYVPTVLDTLAGFVRDRAPRKRAPYRVGDDVQVALSAIGRVRSKANGSYAVDLRETNLCGGKLIGDFEGADFSGARLGTSKPTVRALDAQGAILRRACFNRAEVGWTNFWGADLERSDFTGLRLRSTVFIRARLRAADCTRSVWVAVEARDAVLRGAVLFAADVSRASGLEEGQIRGAVTDSRTKLPAGLVAQPSLFDTLYVRVTAAKDCVEDALRGGSL